MARLMVLYLDIRKRLEVPSSLIIRICFVESTVVIEETIQNL